MRLVKRFDDSQEMDVWYIQRASECFASIFTCLYIGTAWCLDGSNLRGAIKCGVRTFPQKPKFEKSKRLKDTRL
jgi:hypothetical protein